jgi:hypothetical protein
MYSLVESSEAASSYLIEGKTKIYESDEEGGPLLGYANQAR